MDRDLSSEGFSGFLLFLFFAIIQGLQWPPGATLSSIFTRVMAMRKVIDPQVPLGGTDIGAIEINPKSRDDIPQILRGLQRIYTTPAIRERVFAILEEVLPQRPSGGSSETASPDTGRPGMAQWTILVLGMLRLGLNIDYDRLQELANEHSTLRQMLGHGDWADTTHYELQTLKDNVRLLTPEVLDRINLEIVRAGHEALKKTWKSP